MQTVLTAYAEQGIKLAIESKRVKHINFRIKSIDEAPFTSLLSVSYPMRMPQHLLMQSLEHRLAWAIDCQQKQRKLKELKPKKPAYINDIKDLAKEKEISEDDERRASDDIQKITDKYIETIDSRLSKKESDLMAV